MTRFALIVIAVLLLVALLAVAVVSCRRLKQKLRDVSINKALIDSANFKAARQYVIDRRHAEEKLIELLKQSSLARADEQYHHYLQDSVKEAKIRRLESQIAGINTSHASTAKLDSLQFALYGPAPDDSVHTIPLDYSRKLTGDALRFPIEQRLATMWKSRHDSLESHSGRLIDSYRADINLLRNDQEDAHRTLDTVMHTVGVMQGDLNEKDKANERLRKARNRERVMGLALIITALVL